MDVCGSPTFPNTTAVLATATTTAKNYLCTTTGILMDIRSFFQCRTWYPLYRNTVHDAMCYSATDGFSWIASTQFVVVFMAMIILTCRVVLYDDGIISVQDDEHLQTDTENQELKVAADDVGSTAEKEMESSTSEKPAIEELEIDGSGEAAAPENDSAAHE
jgi:hypothetical protein